MREPILELLAKIADLRVMSGKDPSLGELASAAGRSREDVNYDVQLLAAQGLVEGIQIIGASGFTAIRLTPAGARAATRGTPVDDQAIAIRITGDGNQIALAQRSVGTYQSPSRGGPKGVLSKIGAWILAHKVATITILVIACGSGYVAFRYG